jgi:hypothetical protein
MLKKLMLFPPLLAFGCLVSGGYGALHNQISYTVSPDYFHGFKFRQFAIPEAQQNRLGASIVGWHASWWMGLLIGMPVLLVGLVMPDWKTYLSRCLIAYGIVAATALMVGLLALAWASYAIMPANLPPSHVDPLTPSARAAFLRAGTMHNFSYIGGFLGILTGTIYLLAERVRLSRRVKAYHVPTATFRTAYGWGLLLAGPFVVITPYLFASHFVGSLNSIRAGWLALGFSVAVGLCGVALLTFPRMARVLFGIAYAPMMGFLVMNYGFTFNELLFG